MQFRCPEDLEMIRKVVREFAEYEVAPEASKRDEEERIDHGLFNKMIDLGLTGMVLPEQYGGSGGDFLTLTVVLEEISKACASTAALLAAHIVTCGWPIHQFGSEAQKKAFLPVLANGSKLGTCSFPNRRSIHSPVVHMINAAPEGDIFHLNGLNMYASAAGGADLYVVFTEENNAFIVEKGTPGFSFGVQKKKLGLRSLITGAVRFEDCKVPKQNLLGKVGDGRMIASTVMDLENICNAALAVGIAQAALDAAVAYAKERKQFGKPIGQQQGVSFKLADMAAAVEAARWLAYQAAWRKDAGLSYAKEAGFARRFAADASVKVTIEAVQVFGGYGYMQEYSVERYMRDAKCIQADEGLDDMQDDAIWQMLAD